jgi:hypothetical protein
MHTRLTNSPLPIFALHLEKPSKIRKKNSIWKTWFALYENMNFSLKIWIFLWKYEFFFENMNFSLKIWIFLWKFENIILTFAAIWVFYFFSIQKWANALNDYFCKWIWLSSTFELFFCKKRNVHLHLIERNSISKEVQQSRMKGRRKNIIKHL